MSGLFPQQIINNMLFNTLQQIGLQDKEITVYLGLLNLGPAAVTTIAKKSGLNRTSCYDLLEKLEQRGLVSKIKKGAKTLFDAGDPERLLIYIEREKVERAKQLDNNAKMIKELLPELKSMASPNSTRPKVQFFEGEKGMRLAYEDTLNSQETILAYANIATMHEGLPNFFPEYYARRAQKNINIKAIFPKNDASLARHREDIREMRESIILPESSQTFSPEINIYGDKMLIASWKEKMAVIIQSKELAEQQKLIFKIVWDCLKNNRS